MYTADPNNPRRCYGISPDVLSQIKMKVTMVILEKLTAFDKDGYHRLSFTVESAWYESIVAVPLCDLRTFRGG